MAYEAVHFGDLGRREQTFDRRGILSKVGYADLSSSKRLRPCRPSRPRGEV